MECPKLDPDLTVAEVLTRWPETIPTFIRHRMGCVGCAIAPFETLAEVATIYGLNLEYFLRELQEGIEGRDGDETD